MKLESSLATSSANPSWDDVTITDRLPDNPASLNHSRVSSELEHVAQRGLPLWQSTIIGHSVEGRPLPLIQLGQGNIRVLLWSQMHGDEPTHTAVLIALLHWMADHQRSPIAAQICQQCSLALMPMLNPDGAERWTRFNAQGIDINRDARLHQTPEGRTLWSAVRSFQPQFGFNLHNQNRRTCVAGTGLPAAVSVLAPPVDARGTETAELRDAQAIAGRIARATHDLAPGRVSRYPADFMARAFGESIQQTGCRTVLIEAGCWPSHSPFDLVHLHLLGLVSALHSIATGSFGPEDAEYYHALPEHHATTLFDVKIPRVLPDSDSHAPDSVTDLGVHQPIARYESGSRGFGRIVDLGDLQETRGLVEYERTGGSWRYGRIHVEPSLTPDTFPNHARFMEWLSHGITTVIGFISVDDARHVQSYLDRWQERCPLNIGWLIDARRIAKDAEASAIDILWRAIVQGGALAVVVDKDIDLRSSALRDLPIPCIMTQVVADDSESVRPVWLPSEIGYGQAWQRSSYADVVWVRPSLKSVSSSVPVPELVLIGGTLVWQAGMLVEEHAGRWLRFQDPKYAQ